MNILKVKAGSLTKDEAAKNLGMKTYDGALPQYWLDTMVNRIMIHPDIYKECFDKEEDLILLAQFFQFNPNTRQVKDSKLLIALLKMMKELNGNL